MPFDALYRVMCHAMGMLHVAHCMLRAWLVLTTNANMHRCEIDASVALRTAVTSQVWCTEATLAVGCAFSCHPQTQTASHQQSDELLLMMFLLFCSFA